MRDLIRTGVTLLVLHAGSAVADSATHPVYERMFETTFESKKQYIDPFNEVDVDVIFKGNGNSWRVPAFWRGKSIWTVRFAPPTPGEYVYRLESTDAKNPDLNGHEGNITITAYSGSNTLLRHGPLRVSSNGRFLEHADGAPFFWLGDNLYTTLSDRISWEGFQELVSDRKAKGFTVAEVIAGGAPAEEFAPVDPGYRNEGGAVWDPEFKRINPLFFDYADRRIRYLVDAGITPAIYGAWAQVLGQMGLPKMKQHWRYIIARYGAYPVLWILGGEIYDPPKEQRRKSTIYSPPTGWNEVARYVRATDPYHRLLSAEEWTFPYNIPLEDPTLTDFELHQPSYMGWDSAALEVAQLNTHWARTNIRKPLVVGEIGMEKAGAIHLENFQRAAFWLAMLNGAAGFSYGTIETATAFSPDKPFQHIIYSFRTWEEGMTSPGSYQAGINAKLLQNYPWWRFEPHPEWVVPRGTTLLEPRVGEPNLGSFETQYGDPTLPGIPDFPSGEWKAKGGGNMFLPYAAGIPGELRIIYLPYFGIVNGIITPSAPPTILGMEPGIAYRAYYWEPSQGIKVDLGTVKIPLPGALMQQDHFDDDRNSAWTEYGAKGIRANGHLSVDGQWMATLRKVSVKNSVVAVDASGAAEAAILLRFRDTANYLAAIYSAKEKSIYLVERANGIDGKKLGLTPISDIGAAIRLSAEVRDDMAAVSLTDGQKTYAAPIVSIGQSAGGKVGLMHRDDGATQSLAHFELRAGPTLIENEHLERKLYDANGVYRGELAGVAGLPHDEFNQFAAESGWDDFGKHKHILLGAYRPERLPFAGDWVLVLERQK